MLTLLIDGSVSPTPSQDEIQDRRPVPWGIRIPIGGVQRLFLPRVAWGVAGAGGDCELRGSYSCNIPHCICLTVTT